MSKKDKIKILIIIPVDTNIFNERLKECIDEICPPDVTFDIRHVEGKNARTHIQNRTDYYVNSPLIMNTAIKLQKEKKYDGIFVTDFDFCGVEATRENVDVPVIGGFRPQAMAAIALSEKIGLITLTDTIVAMQEEHFRNFGILPNLACIIPTGLGVQALANPELAKQKVFEKAIEAIALGAQSIILGCTGFIGIARPVAKMLKKAGFDIPVTDPNHMAFTYLVALVRNKLMQSRLTYYKDVPQKKSKSHKHDCE
jgi:Asp/Glu/hydantoin racemase